MESASNLNDEVLDCYLMDETCDQRLLLMSGTVWLNSSQSCEVITWHSSLPLTHHHHPVTFIKHCSNIYCTMDERTWAWLWLLKSISTAFSTFLHIRYRQNFCHSDLIRTSCLVLFNFFPTLLLFFFIFIKIYRSFWNVAQVTVFVLFSVGYLVHQCFI